MNTPTRLLLNIAHAVDHMFLLIFATAVTKITSDFGLARWEDMMPYSVGAFFMFGIGSMPSGKLGDSWGRRKMMVIFFIGMGISAMLVAFTQSPWQIAIALGLLGCFASIYHPVGIPMLLQDAAKPGITIGVNGLAGNLGIAVAALVTGLFVKYFGWRAAFFVPGLVSIALGLLFMKVAPREMSAPAKKKAPASSTDRATMVRIVAVMTMTAITSSLVFNFTTNGNAELLRERFRGVVEDPAMLGLMLAAVYVFASFAQLAVGSMLDRYPLKRVYLLVAVIQTPLFYIAAQAQGWALLIAVMLFMISVFGAIPFTDALIVRYVDNSMRSRVSGVRLAISFGISSIAVYLLGPVVKAKGFETLLYTMAIIGLITLTLVNFLPSDTNRSPLKSAASVA
jgi:MFS family permease